MLNKLEKLHSNELFDVLEFRNQLITQKTETDDEIEKHAVKHLITEISSHP